MNIAPAASPILPDVAATTIPATKSSSGIP